MKMRSCFVSNSSSSCFIVDSSSVGWVKQKIIETVASFLDDKEGQDTERHINEVKTVLDRDFNIFQLDRRMPKKELSRLMCWTNPSNYVNENDWGKVMVVDQDENTLDWTFGDDGKGNSASSAVMDAFGKWFLRLEPDSRSWQDVMSDDD